jgi:hypothetical protein
MLHFDRIPERPPSDDVISLDHLGGIRAFIERCRIDSISDEMREIVETRWPDLARKLPRKGV